MKILFVEHQANKRTGGIEAATLGLASSLLSRGHTVFRESTLEQLDSRPDVVHFHGIWNREHLKQHKLARNLEIPVVVSPHGLLEPWALRHKAVRKKLFFEIFERARLINSNAVHTTSDREASHVNKLLGEDKAVVVPIGVEFPLVRMKACRENFGWAHEEIVLLFLGRLHPVKSILELIGAFIDVNEKREGLDPSLRLVIVGSGEERYVRNCKALADSKKRSAKIDFLGAVWGQSRWDLLRSADLLCLPSKSENFGIVVAEAAAVGTNALVSTETPWSDSIDKLPCTVVEPSTESIGEGIRRFVDSYTRSDQNRSNRIASAQSLFDWKVVVQQYESMYESIL